MVDMIVRILKNILGNIRGKPGETAQPMTVRDFSFNSGERQIGATLDGIRQDHVARYNLAVNCLKDAYNDIDRRLGLDVFSANGYGSYLLAKRLGCFILGIEGSEEAVKFANTHYSSSSIFYVNKLFPFSLPPDKFDFITCFESLEHVEDDTGFLCQMIASLKQGGGLLLSVPNEELQPLCQNPNKFHYRHYLHNDIIARLAGEHGMVLRSWFGQNIYRFESGVRTGLLHEAEMDLRESVQGQVLVYVFAKS